jgi:hypothetical protein
MSSKNAPPVAVAQGEAGVANDAILAVPTLGTNTDGKEFTDNYNMLTGNNDHYSLSEQLVHHCAGAIFPVHWTACKAVLAFHAGSGVSKLKTTTKKDKEAACLELYYNRIESLDEEHFGKDAHHTCSITIDSHLALRLVVHVTGIILHTCTAQVLRMSLCRVPKRCDYNPS